MENLDEKKDGREAGGYKAMSSSIGMSDWKKVRSYMKSDEFKEKIADAKKRAKEASNPEAYLASVERKILKGHFGKSEDMMDLQELINKLNSELGIIRDTEETEDEEAVDEAEKKKVPSKHPGADLPAKKKSEIVKRAKKGEDIGKPGKKFKDIEAKAAKRYGSEESGKRVAAASMWRAAHKKGYK